MRLDTFPRHRISASSGANSPAAGKSQQNDSYFLHAGQVHVSAQLQSVILILGSCVGVCIWDPVHHIGGATHYLLPEWDGRGAASPRYGTVAIETLLQKLIEAGAKREQLIAKVFGGGCLFDSMRRSEARKDSLGERNIETAMAVLAKERVPIVYAEVRKNRGQRIVFHTGTGESLVTSL
jgi:chemotaxis protein CheD